MKSGLEVATPPAKPLVIYDGDCNFCSLWIHRWQHATGEHVNYLPYQDPQLANYFPNQPIEPFESAVHLLEPDGSVYSGAEAAFRALAHNPRETWLLDWYEHSTGFARASEWCYRQIAQHRPFFSFLTSLGWGRRVEKANYTLVRSVFLRALGAIYLIAFVSLWVQILGLIGSKGILPVSGTMESVHEQVASAKFAWSRYHLFPTFCWFSNSDGFLQIQCAAGTVLAMLLLVGIAPAPCLFLLWAVYLSLVTVGREFLSFQWDMLLLETGFLAIFFAPLQIWLGRRVAPPSRVVLWLVRWLLFRLMFASGCVKLLSGDPTWRNLTALNYHYETQPLPTWVGWYAHQFPAAFQKASTAIMFTIELGLPFLIFGPRRIRQIPCIAFILLQLAVMLTGNYCFFNLLSIALCIPLLDDTALRNVLPSRWRRPNPQAMTHETPEKHHTEGPTPTAPKTDSVSQGGHPPQFGASRGYQWRWPLVITIPVACVLVAMPVLQFSGMFNLGIPWPRPVLALYESISPLRSLNGYGLFAVMTTNRAEIVIEGSNDGTNWLAYEFKYKPGDLTRRPRFVEPHQPRLDWQMWFAALGTYQRNPWLVNFCAQLLQASPPVVALLKRNPFPENPPRYIRAVIYEYHFTTFAERHRSGAWWKRELKGAYLPAISIRNESRRPPEELDRAMAL